VISENSAAEHRSASTSALLHQHVKRFSGLYTGPYFDTSIATNITAQLGTHAFLPCKVKQLGNKSVSIFIYLAHFAPAIPAAATVGAGASLITAPESHSRELKGISLPRCAIVRVIQFGIQNSCSTTPKLAVKIVDGAATRGAKIDFNGPNCISQTSQLLCWLKLNYRDSRNYSNQNPIKL